ncbi:MAG: carcinine hydrolase/isopenicillin-N N-acyltransferase family protein [Syntrophorhabdaceae bacterium]
MRQFFFRLGFLITGLYLLFSSHAGACTIWASAGLAVEGGGTLIAKNRDNRSTLRTHLATVCPAEGWRFLGILDIEADGYVVAAVNEKGLAVVNAAANSVPPAKRHVATEDFTQKILVKFDSVDSVLKEKDLFRKTHPAIYIIADSSKIMSVEVAPGGNVSINARETGTIAFTNHFTADELIDANEKMSRDSLLRLRRINELCSATGRAHAFDDFIAMSRDTNSGRPGAVLRHAKNGSSIRTLATWVIELKPGRNPRLYVQLMNTGQKASTTRMTLDKKFWDPIGETE